MKPCETAPGVVLTTAEEAQLLCPDRELEAEFGIVLTVEEADAALHGLAQKLWDEKVPKKDERYQVANELSKCIGQSMTSVIDNEGKLNIEAARKIFGVNYVTQAKALIDRRQVGESERQSESYRERAMQRRLDDLQITTA